MTFRACDLDLDPMTFMYELDPYSLKMYLQTKSELTGQGFQNILTDRQTDRQAGKQADRQTEMT